MNAFFKKTDYKHSFATSGTFSFHLKFFENSSTAYLLLCRPINSLWNIFSWLLKRHWTSILHHPLNFSTKSWNFYTIRSVGICNDRMLILIFLLLTFEEILIFLALGPIYFSKSTSINTQYTIQWPMGHSGDDVLLKRPHESALAEAAKKFGIGSILKSL